MLLSTMHHGWFPWFPIIPLLFWGLTIFVVVTVLRRGRMGHWRSTSSAEAILAERFARGEIDEQEYRSASAVLQTRKP